MEFEDYNALFGVRDEISEKDFVLDPLEFLLVLESESTDFTKKVSSKKLFVF